MMTIATWEGRQLRRKNGHKNRWLTWSLFGVPFMADSFRFECKKKDCPTLYAGEPLWGGWYSGEPRDISEFVGIENLPMGTTAAT